MRPHAFRAMIADTTPSRRASPAGRPRCAAVACLVGALCAAAAADARQTAAVLRAVSAVPAHVAGRFPDDAVFAATRTGDYVVLDRRAHAVFLVDTDGRDVRRILGVGPTAGELLNPAALAVSRDGLIAVADSPDGFDRIQYFNASGMRVGGFYLPVPQEPRLTIPELLVSSGDSLAFPGDTFLVNRPEWGTLFAELDTTGRVLRQVGALRPTGHAPDRDLELGLNIGIPLATPDGGFIFVFRTGVPIFRRYDRDGRLLFERHIEGPELDARMLALPTVWPARRAGRRPVVPPLVRAAAVDPAGRLWVSLAEPFTYVYGVHGEKLRAVQLRGAGVLWPSSLFFTPQGRLLVAPGGYEFEVD
jgi:hypothetical protein